MRLKHALVLAAFLVLLACLLFGALLPRQRPAPPEPVEPTAARVARGEYLVKHVADCLGCHSQHELAYGFPIKAGTEGGGGVPFDAQAGIPGTVTPSNLTPDPEAGLGAWSDGEILRAIREGVDRQGRALFPIMPYQSLRGLSDEDARAIVVYLRTLRPLPTRAPPKQIAFPVSQLYKLAPAPLRESVPGPAADALSRGRYLTQIAGCADCHTPHDAHGQPLAGHGLSGGWEMRGPWGTAVSANLTVAQGTWLSQASKEEFIGRIKAFASMDPKDAPARPGRNTPMPWWAFSGMSEQDLGFIYDYLRAQPAEGGPVDSFPGASAAHASR